ncbi:hypothetical protein ACOSQ3_032618 [Xanthoceras sorbifolium]
MLVTYGKNERNGHNGYSGLRGSAGYPADKVRNSRKFQSGKDGVGSSAAPSGPSGNGGSVNKDQGAAEGGIKTFFDNYRKKNAVSKKGGAMNSGVAQGSRFDILFYKKSKGRKPMSSAKGGPSVDGKKVFDDISNRVENPGKGSVFGTGILKSAGGESFRPIVDIAKGSFDVVASNLKKAMEVALE